MILYPKTPRHYEGCITKSKSSTYQVRIRTRNIFKSLKTYEEAFEYLKNINIENNYDIKNIIYKYETYSEVMLTQNCKMLIDNDDIEKIQNILCFVDIRDNVKYARFRFKNSGHSIPLFIHNYIMDYKTKDNITIDHLNGNGLDNRKQNLRFATQSLQTRNRKIKKIKNDSDIIGITNMPSGKFNACFKYQGIRYRKTLNTKEEAILWLENKKKTILPEEHLNLPNQTLCQIQSPN